MMKREVRGFGKARFHVIFDGTIEVRQSALWVARCPGLDVIAQGTTEEEAWASLEDAIRMMCRYYGAGIERWLLERGLEKRADKWTRPFGPLCDVFLDWGAS